MEEKKKPSRERNSRSCFLKLLDQEKVSFREWEQFQCSGFYVVGFVGHNMFISGANAAAAKSLQLYPTLCDPIDGSPPGSLVPGILQARTPEWVAISFSNAWKWKVKVKSLSRVWPSATPWTAAFQAPPSMGFSRQEDWSGVPLPFPGHISSSIQTLLFLFNV